MKKLKKTLISICLVPGFGCQVDHPQDSESNTIPFIDWERDWFSGSDITAGVLARCNHQVYHLCSFRGYNGKAYHATFDSRSRAGTLKIDGSSTQTRDFGCYTLTALAPKWGFYTNPITDSSTGTSSILSLMVYSDGTGTLKKISHSSGKFVESKEADSVKCQQLQGP